MALAGIAGLEPTHARIKIWCLTDLAISLYIKIKMGWVVGFEPTYTGATTLGLNHLTIPTILIHVGSIPSLTSHKLDCVNSILFIH